MRKTDFGVAYLVIIAIAVTIGLAIPAWRYFTPTTKSLAPPYYLYDDVEELPDSDGLE